jgi:hypothetical protein
MIDVRTGGPKVKQERSNWRDEEFSKRHRKYGFPLAATDIDFLLIEYTSGEVVAIIEHKNICAKLSNSTASIKIISKFCDKSLTPFFVVRYAKINEKEFTFKVFPINKSAKEKLKKSIVMDEYDYVEFLWKLRNLEIPSTLFDENRKLIEE